MTQAIGTQEQSSLFQVHSSVSFKRLKVMHLGAIDSGGKGQEANWYSKLWGGIVSNIVNAVYPTHHSELISGIHSNHHPDVSLRAGEEAACKSALKESMHILKTCDEGLFAKQHCLYFSLVQMRLCHIWVMVLLWLHLSCCCDPVSNGVPVITAIF